MNLEENLRNDIKSVLVFNPKISILRPNSIIQDGLKAKRVIEFVFTPFRRILPCLTGAHDLLEQPC